MKRERERKKEKMQKREKKTETMRKKEEEQDTCKAQVAQFVQYKR